MPTIHRHLAPAETFSRLESVLLFGTVGAFGVMFAMWFGPVLIFRGLKLVVRPTLVAGLVFIT